MRTRRSNYEKIKKRKHTSYERDSQAETIRAIQRAHDRLVGKETYIDRKRKSRVKKQPTLEVDKDNL